MTCVRSQAQVSLTVPTSVMHLLATGEVPTYKEHGKDDPRRREGWRLLKTLAEHGWTLSQLRRLVLTQPDGWRGVERIFGSGPRGLDKLAEQWERATRYVDVSATATVVLNGPWASAVEQTRQLDDLPLGMRGQCEALIEGLARDALRCHGKAIKKLKRPDPSRPPAEHDAAQRWLMGQAGLPRMTLRQAAEGLRNSGLLKVSAPEGVGRSDVTRWAVAGVDGRLELPALEPLWVGAWDARIVYRELLAGGDLRDAAAALHAKQGSITRAANKLRALGLLADDGSVTKIADLPVSVLQEADRRWLNIEIESRKGRAGELLQSRRDWAEEQTYLHAEAEPTEWGPPSLTDDDWDEY